MNIVIAGGSGFLGSQLIEVALQYGHQVTYLSRRRGKGSVFESSNLHFIKGDLLDSTTAPFPIQSFDLLIDCVGAIKPNQLRSLNVQATKGVIKLCKNKHIPKLVYISANSGYPAYLKSKREAEQLIKKSGLNYLLVRPNLLFGKERPLSLLQAKCLFFFAYLPFFASFFKKRQPHAVREVAETILQTLENNPSKKILTWSHS
ncbi:NADH dehydrogenase [Streptococcus pseudoporcinus]|uniref:NADH dehydrogenase n=1 Tax=Streptococcus pseudoporcinus TaxID=361101 RepID=A0A4U9XUS0_9STRE|nr:NAD(P)H-binding protein [Streptococcus pseudoporcinus]VTS17444.1 NADH dehydrogenase [Streptococcus pseudoporcinus]